MHLILTPQSAATYLLPIQRAEATQLMFDLLRKPEVSDSYIILNEVILITILGLPSSYPTIFEFSYYVSHVRYSFTPFPHQTLSGLLSC